MRRKGERRRHATRLYQTIVDQARRPEFYLRCGVPDTQTGRFEMICLHMFPLLRRLKNMGAAGAELGQATHDEMFADMDRSLREMGIGDLGVGKRVKKLASSLYGRIAAYEAGLAGGENDLGEALRRNLYGTVLNEDGTAPAAGGSPSDAQIEAMGAYLGRSVAAIEAADGAALMAGDIKYPEVEFGALDGPMEKASGGGR